MTVKEMMPILRRRGEGRPDSSDRSWPSLQRDINRLFEGFFTRLPLAPFSDDGFGRVSPGMDVRETEGDYFVEMEMPGMSEKDIAISFSDGLLTLKGEKKWESEPKTGRYHCSERVFGRIERSIPLAEEIDPVKTEAKFRNGLLSIRLPKRTPQKADSKKIPIKIE